MARYVNSHQIYRKPQHPCDKDNEWICYWQT